MKKIIYSLLLLLIFFDSKAQNISFRSNGHVNLFKKIDTLFYTEYAGKKPSSKTASIDNALINSFLQFDSSFGFTSKNVSEIKNTDAKLASFKKKFSTSFYAYSDNSLEAPTSVLFFKPKNEANVVKDFSSLGKIVKHPSLSGFYNLHLNTDIYNNGDKIFSLCDSLYNVGTALIIEPVFVRRIKINTDDPLYPNQWNITNIGQFAGTAGADMKVTQVWPDDINVRLGYTGVGVRVAVIDCGVDLNHPDFNGNLLPGFDASGNNTAGAPLYDEWNAHGTECAGIIGSVRNNIGAVGVAYHSQIIPIRMGTVIYDASTKTTYIQAGEDWIASCFYYAINNGADIISNSWGGGSQSAQIDQAINVAVTQGRNNLGTIVLFAAGNENSSIIYPASNPQVIAVGASSECDTRKRSSIDPSGVSCDGVNGWGSNFGTGLDLIAPGVNISTTTLPTAADYTNAYNIAFGGTSAATPNTAGVLALMLSANPNLTGQEARNILESTCDKIGGYVYSSNVSGQPNGTWCNDAGYGRVNAQAAVNKVISLMFPLLSISGTTIICTSGVYSVPNLPAGSTVTWTCSANVFLLAQNTPGTNLLTITNQGWYGATGAQLTASIVIPGINVPLTLTKTIVNDNDNSGTTSYRYMQEACMFYGVQHPTQSGLVSTSTSLFVHMGCTVYVYLNLGLGQTVNFVPSGGSNPIFWYYTGGTLYFQLPYGSGGVPFTFSITGDGACYTKRLLFFAQSNNGNANSTYSLLASPNPAADVLNVTFQNAESVIDNSSSSTGITADNSISNNQPITFTEESKRLKANVESFNSANSWQLFLFDMNGKLIKTINSVQIGQHISLKVKGLSAGIYMLKAVRGKEYVTQKIIIYK